MRLPSFPLLERVAAGSLRVWLIVGILLRVTKLRDRFDPLALVFYTTPWPVIAAGLAVLGLHAARLGRGHAVRRYIILTAGAIFTWVALSWNAGPPVTEERPAVRVALWNVGRPGPWRLARLAAWLKNESPDVISIAEWNGLATRAEWVAAFPDYQFVELFSEMRCLVRGEVLGHENGKLDPNSFYGLTQVRVRGVELSILQADLYAGPTTSRAPALKRLAEIAHDHRGERLVMLGDFNTPRDSYFFDRFRPEMTHVIARMGEGLAETWPMPLPVLTLDHLWCNERLRPLACKVGMVWWSDHRPVVADFGL